MKLLIVDTFPILHKTYRVDPKYFAAKGHEVSVICPEPTIAEKELLKDYKGIEFAFTGEWRAAKKPSDLTNKFTQIVHMARRIRKAITSKQYDVIRAVGFIPAYATLVARHGYNIPIITNLSDFYSDLYKQFGLPFPNIVGAFLQRMESHIVKESDVLLVDTPTQRKYWTHWGLDEKKCAVLPNGYDSDLFQPQINPLKIRFEFGISEPFKMIYYHGDISELDGLDILLSAAPRVLKEHKVKFMIVGYGPEKYLGMLRKMVEENGLRDHVIFTGRIPYANIAEYLAAADLCVAPFRLTATSDSSECLKIVEYVAMGKPVVSACGSGVKELFGDVLSYVPPEDPDALAESITKLLRCKSLPRKTIEKMKMLREKFAWRNIVKHEEKIIEATLNRSVCDYRALDYFRAN